MFLTGCDRGHSGFAAERSRMGIRRRVGVLRRKLADRSQRVVQQGPQLIKQLMFALAPAEHLGLQFLRALGALALALGVKRPLKERLRLAWGEVRGEGVKLRGLSGKQLLDIAGQPDIEHAKVPVDEQC